MGQSAARSRANEPSPKQVIWKRVAVGVPGGSVRGPMRFSAIAYAATISPTSSRTSGCGWYAGNDPQIVVAPSVTSVPDVEGGEDDRVEDHGSDAARDEEPPED